MAVCVQVSVCGAGVILTLIAQADKIWLILVKYILVSGGRVTTTLLLLGVFPGAVPINTIKPSTRGIPLGQSLYSPNLPTLPISEKSKVKLFFSFCPGIRW